MVSEMCRLLFVLMPQVGLEEQARKGKEGKEAGRKNAIDLLIEECNYYQCNLRQIVFFSLFPQ